MTLGEMALGAFICRRPQASCGDIDEANPISSENAVRSLSMGSKKLKLRKLLLPIGVATCLALSLGVSAETGAESPKLGDYQTKGFLTEYSYLPDEPDQDGAYRYLDPEADFGKYDKLLVDRIRIWFKEDARYKGIDPEELKTLTDYFYQAIEKAMGDDYPLVAEPGPDVLRLRIAVTDLVPNKPEASVTSLVVPFLWVGEATAGAVTREVGTTPFTGEATMELEALDSVSSQQLAAFIETRLGKKFAWNEGIGEGVTSYLGAYSKWDYTKKAMDQWAQRLRARLDELHHKSTAM